MYLKRLEVIGFKSFAERTVLEFERGITAIVGPNGCGKSNISDAVRWVLGEQSAKMLRGSSMQDVIFSGTEERKPVGFAEVALTFADTDKVLPVEYNEVTIARRVYRTGESEYTINKTLCRLKDIHQLFLGTGVGSNPYSMIEQGNIDQLISSKPEERRFVFEEAAGITKFKAHKKEALRKLESTEANLIRIQDILREVKKQINAINRQATKAKAYQVLMEELKSSEVKLNAHKFQDLNQTIVSFDNEARDLEYLRGKEEESLSLREAEVSQLRLQLESASQAVSQKNAERMLLENDAVRIQHSVSASRQRIEEATRKVAQWEQELQRIDEKLNEMTQQLDGGAGDLSKMVEESEALGRRLADKEAEVEALQKEMEAIQGSLIEQKSQIVGTLAQESQIKNEMAHLQAEEKALKQEKGRLVSEMEANEAKEKQTTLDLQSLNQIQREDEMHLKEIEEALSSKQQQFSQARFSLESLDKDLAKRGAALSEKKSKLELLIDLKNRFEGYYHGVKSVLQGAHSGNPGLKGICGVVASLLQVPREVELAIEVALGSRIQNIVTETGEDAKRAVEFLKRHNAGQATFLPLDLLKEGHIYQLPAKWQHAGVIGNACDFVKFDSKYYNVFKTLLGNTILVKDLESALAVARQGDVTCQLVSLEGDAINSRGAITGGSNQNKVHGFISRDAEMELLKREVQELEQSLDGVLDRRQALIQERDGSEKAVQELQSTLHPQRVAVATKQNEKAKMEAALSQTAENRFLFETELKNVEQQIAVNLERQQQLNQRVSSTELLNLNLQTGLTTAENEILEKTAAKDRLIAELGQLKVSLAQVQEKEKNFASQRAQLESGRADQLRLREQYSKEIEEARRSSEETVAAIARLEGEFGALEQKRSGFGMEFEELARKKEALQGQILSSEEDLRRARTRVSELQTQLHSLEIKLAQEKLRRENLVAKVSEEYQISLEAVSLDPQERVDWAAVEQRVAELRRKIEAMGPVNLVAIEELKELEERHAFLEKQHEDLVTSKQQLHEAINKINVTTREMFQTTFEKIRENFKETFAQLFNGGKADIILLDDTPDVLEAGIDIIARPPGKKLTSVSLMSGGERALTAVALLFALFKVKPSPFCVLDEIDAPLDESNINRFVEMVKGFAAESQFVVITHNKRTIAASHAMYGITMEESGISKVVSVKFRSTDEQEASGVPAGGRFGFVGK